MRNGQRLFAGTMEKCRAAISQAAAIQCGRARESRPSGRARPVAFHLWINPIAVWLGTRNGIGCPRSLTQSLGVCAASWQGLSSATDGGLSVPSAGLDLVAEVGEPAVCR